MKSNYILMNYEEIARTYPKIAKHSATHEGRKYILFPKDAVFEQTLSIDFFEEHDGIIVMGDLKVNGNIANYEGDYGATLIVCNDAYADNLIAGGAIIDIMGNAHIKYLCLAHYNDGILDIGKLVCPLLISCGDHLTRINDKTALGAEFNTDYYGSESDNQFLMEDLGKIFPDKPWIEIDTEEDDDLGEAGFSCYFSAVQFIEHELKKNKIENIVQQVKTGIEQLNEIEDYYLNKNLVSTDKIFSTVYKKIKRPAYEYSLPKGSNVKFIKDNFEIQDDLILDKVNYLSENCCALFIDGDLIVNGTIYNSYGKEGVTLFVTGNVYCANFIISSAQVFINKDLMVDNILVCDLPEIDIDYGPDLKVRQIKTASLAIIESDYGLKYSLGPNLNNRVFTTNEDREKDAPLISHLSQIIDNKYWSKKNRYFKEKKFYEAIVKNRPVLKPGFEDNITKLIDKLSYKDSIMLSITDNIERIKSFLDKHTIKYYSDDESLEIIQPEFRFHIRYAKIYRFSFGTYPRQKYGKKDLKQYKSDLVFYLGKYLRNQLKLDLHKKGKNRIWDFLMVFENENWSRALDSGISEVTLSEIYSETTSVESVMTNCTIDENEIEGFLETIS